MFFFFFFAEKGEGTREWKGEDKGRVQAEDGRGERRGREGGERFGTDGSGLWVSWINRAVEGGVDSQVALVEERYLVPSLDE